MRRFPLACCCCAAILVGCRKSQNQASTDTTTTTSSGAVASGEGRANVPFAAIAGKWTVRAMTRRGDSTILTYVLNMTSSGSGSTITFENRPPMAVNVAVLGDNIVIDAGPYSSVLRKGVQVTMHTASHLQNGKLVGTGTWHYATSRPDSVLSFRIEGTHSP
jgi:hypothetical protein